MREIGLDGGGRPVYDRSCSCRGQEVALGIRILVKEWRRATLATLTGVLLALALGAVVLVLLAPAPVS